MKKYHCGYKDSPEWLRKILSIKFNASCKIHDMDYNKKSPYSKLQADLRFLEHCIRQAQDSKFWLFMAYLGFFIVRFLGDKAYKGKKLD
jgi:hypothetical protein